MMDFMNGERKNNKPNKSRFPLQAFMRLSITILISFLFCFCTTSFSQDARLASYKTYFDNNLEEWTRSFKDFKLSDFRFTDTAEFEDLPFRDTTNLKEFYELYKPALSFSIDNTKFLDIYSYGLNLEKKGSKVVANEDIDQLVSLCDLRKNKWMRIFFCGLSTRIDEAVWITNSKFILAGTSSGEDNVFHPKILVGDTNSRILLIYDDNETVATKDGYTSPKYKKLNIQDE